MHILRLLLLALVVPAIPCAAQNVKTKDGVVLGKRSDFISACKKEAKQQLLKIKGMEFEAGKYCACMCDNLVPTINSWELEKLVEEDKLAEFMLEDENLQVILKCLDGNFKLKDDYQFGTSEHSELEKKAAIKLCVDELIKDEETKEFWTRERSEKYCDCAITKILSAGYTYKQIMEIEDENSAAFNEIAMPCVTEALKSEPEFGSSNSYNADDIRGGGDSSLVPLVDYLGSGYKLKITIAGVSKYYLFDTGASDLVIDGDTERELLLNGALKKEQYLDKTEYVMANNERVEAQQVKVSDITIGDYTLANVVIGVVEQGSLLCGKSFLDKFKRWEVDQTEKVLILYR